MRPVAPFAEYALTARPEWLEFSFADGSPAVLTAERELIVSRRAHEDIFIRADERLFALGWGGTRNHSLSFLEGAWGVNHLGHHSWLELNGARWNGMGSHRRVLASGDHVSPATGLEFTFTLRPELEPLADELAALRWAPMSDSRVLADWVMERTGFEAPAAALACRHLGSRR